MRRGPRVEAGRPAGGAPAVVQGRGDGGIRSIGLATNRDGRRERGRNRGDGYVLSLVDGERVLHSPKQGTQERNRAQRH